MTRAQSDIALNVAQRCLSHRRSVLHVAKANNTFFMSSFFVIKSQDLGLDYFNEAFSAAGMFFILDRQMSVVSTILCDSGTCSDPKSVRLDLTSLALKEKHH
jgi:hypothetical protein